MSEVAISTSIKRLAFNANETLLKPAWLDNPSLEPLITAANQFIFIKATPTNTSSTVDPVNLTQSNAGASWEINMDGFSAMAGAYAVRLTARLKDGASGTLADNLIRVSVNSVEFARVYVTASSQKCGEHVFWSHTKDTRVAPNGTNDLTFALTSVDPDLEIVLEIWGTDA